MLESVFFLSVHNPTKPIFDMQVSSDSWHIIIRTSVMLAAEQMMLKCVEINENGMSFICESMFEAHWKNHAFRG